MDSKLQAVMVAILVSTGLGLGYLVGSNSGLQSVTSTLTTTAVSTTTAQTTFTSTAVSTETSTLVTGVPINASDIESAFMGFEGSPVGIAVNPNNGRVYILDRLSDNLTIVEQTPFAIGMIALPSSIDGITVDDNSGVAYVGVTGGLEEINSTLVNTSPYPGLASDDLETQVLGVLPVNIKGSLAFDSSNQVIYGTSGDTCSYLYGIDTLPICTYLAGIDVQTGAVVANVSLGYSASNIAVDPKTDMVFATGCVQTFVCDSIASVVNGTSGKVVATLNLGSSEPSTIAVNPSTDVGYVSGDQLVAINGTNGDIVFKVNPLECGAFDNMAVIPYLNEVAAVGVGSYVLVYNGSTGALVNMYSFPFSLGQYVAFDPSISELMVAFQQEPDMGPPSGALIIFNLAGSTGSVDSALVNGNGETC